MCVIAILLLKVLKCLDSELKGVKGDIRSVYSIYSGMIIDGISGVRNQPDPRALCVCHLGFT